MAELYGGFDATTVAPNQPFEILQPGKYPVQIVASEVKSTKDGRGQYLWLEMEIIDGEFVGRKLWDRLNLWNTNTQAVEIAQRSLSAICHAVGVMAVTDSEELHARPMVATVKVRAAREGYDASNEIRGYEPIDGSAPAPVVQQQRAAPAPAAAPAAKTPAWKRTA